ncbi:putative methyltransferase-domain-containing protein [Catenaria anguillulae PL171]|uniref:Putative methyltransferase-domain-containing protein n=1 Tax=Catenaria anguillulae PL171 TaxID=765915 RepID=A0A1Y2HNK2_9FUNG|nr:putative methyltransferase-domain-containing protein [Catenaria anguillulae PL171]
MQATHVVLSESYTTQIPRLRTHFWDWLLCLVRRATNHLMQLTDDEDEPLWTTWDDLSTRASTVMSVLSGPATAGDRIRRFVFDSFTIKVKEASLQAADLGGPPGAQALCLPRTLIDQHIVQYPAGASILELGSGTGLGGLAAQLVDPSAQVIMTDYHLGVLDTLKVSIAMNLPESSSSPHTIQVHQLDWRWYLDSSSSPSPALPLLPHLDVVMAADVVYERASIPAIHGVLSALVTPESTLVLIVLPMRPRYHEDVDDNQAVIEYKGGYYKVYGNEKAAQVMKGLFH